MFTSNFERETVSSTAHEPMAPFACLLLAKKKTYIYSLHTNSCPPIEQTSLRENFSSAQDLTLHADS